MPNPARLKNLLALQELARQEAATARNYLLRGLSTRPGFFRDVELSEAAKWQSLSEQSSASARAVARLLEV